MAVKVAAVKPAALGVVAMAVVAMEVGWRAATVATAPKRHNNDSYCTREHPGRIATASHQSLLGSMSLLRRRTEGTVLALHRSHSSNRCSRWPIEEAAVAAAVAVVAAMVVVTAAAAMVVVTAAAAMGVVTAAAAELPEVREAMCWCHLQRVRSAAGGLLRMHASLWPERAACP